MQSYNVIAKIAQALESQGIDAIEFPYSIKDTQNLESVMENYFQELLGCIVNDLEHLGLRNVRQLKVSNKRMLIDDMDSQGASTICFYLHPAVVNRCIYVKCLIFQGRILMKRYEGCEIDLGLNVPLEFTDLSKL